MMKGRLCRLVVNDAARQLQQPLKSDRSEVFKINDCLIDQQYDRIKLDFTLYSGLACKGVIVSIKEEGDAEDQVKLLQKGECTREF